MEKDKQIKFSVIIPTMLKRQDITQNLLAILCSEESVSEIILINNSDQTIDSHNPKIKVYTKGFNMYVNPSWNWGVELASEEHIAILNDDIIIPLQIFSQISRIDFDSCGVMGACHSFIVETESPPIYKVRFFDISEIKQRTWGFGIFMAMKKTNYEPIPEDLKVWCGDDWLYHSNIKKGNTNGVMFFVIQTKMSATSDDTSFDSIKETDLEIYNKKYRPE